MVSPATYSIYWVRSKTHQNPLCEGYIGITHRDPQNRFKEHRARSKWCTDDVIIEVLLDGLSEKDAMLLEFYFRPRYYIGWNRTIGGRIGQRPHGIHTSGWKHSDQAKKRHADAVRGDKNPMKKKFGKNHHRYKPFTVDGVKFTNLSEARAILNIPVTSLYNRLNSDKWPNYQYLDKKETAPCEAVLEV